MSLYDKASLVLIPSGTKTSKVYSQKPVSGDGDFTFSRSTMATRVNADGVIEKETQNLLLYSNTFSNANWTKSNAVVVGGQSGYDGSNDAWKVTSSAAGTPQLSQSGSSSLMKTHSIYAKAGNVSTLKIWVGATKEFDLSAGTTSSSNSKITDVGNGWYRCEVFDTFLNMNPFWSASAAGEFIYIQDAQQEYGLVARDYIETTTTAVEGGITDNVPRLDYTDSSCPALLLEPQRTNTWTYSEPTSGAIGNINSAGAFSDIDSFSSIGLYGGAILQGGATQYIYDGGSIANSTTYTLSCYMKTSDGAAPVLANSSGSASGDFVFIIGGASKTALDPSINYSITQFSGDIYKVVATMTSAASVTNPPNNGIIKFNTNRNADLEITGFQFEQASYATSYIPTYGSAVTRNVENFSLTGISDLIGQTEGTFFLSYSGIATTSSENNFFSLADSSGYNRLLIGIANQANKVRTYIDVDSGQAGDNKDVTDITSTTKVAMVYTESGNKVKVYINGTKRVDRTMNDTFSEDLTDFVNDNGAGSQKAQARLEQALVFKTALSEEELVDLTTL